MNNTEANNNAPNNVRGRGRGRGNGRGGRRGRGRRAGTFVFVVDPTVQQNTIPVDNGNTEADSNANVDDDDEPEQLSSRSYNVWPDVAICILLEIMAGTYSYLLRRSDTALKQLIWVHSAALLKEKLAENATTDVITAFLTNFSETSMQRKWADMKQRFTRVRNAARETGVGGTVPNMPYYEEIAKITQDDPSIQPEVIYESINMQESGIRSYRRFNDANLMNAIGSDGPETTYLGPTEVDQLVIQKAFADRYPARDSTNNEGPAVPSFFESASAPPPPTTAPAPTPATAPTPTPTPTPTAVPTSTPTTEPPTPTAVPTSTPTTEPPTPTPTPTSASAAPPTLTGATLPPPPSSTPPPPYTSAPPPPPPPYTSAQPPPPPSSAPPPPPPSSAPPPPPPSSAPPPPRSTRTSRNSRTSGEQSSSTDPIEAARQLSDEHMARARQLGVEMMDRMAASQREDREQRLLDVDNMLQRISRNRQIALEDMQARRRQETRERYRMFEEVRSRREADMEEHRRRRMSDMETILNRFAAIRRGDSDTNLNGSSSTDNNN
ncbi:uncharacterized protein EV154DRAFT_572204 [Mucor mucedo]|uniref:uncharacterized protein n=1 Tax=Mucor mucedo TaxID=29922 RepID=UPI0022207498|nr:uncharacterized protein EV154DRAFT_572204 [Mucor mucedo]KAI7865310.1 hypothetical protein EV154DRAFT_572204 [Mucor mucedo]